MTAAVRVIALCGTIAVALSSADLYAQAYFWNGTTSNYNLASNWIDPNTGNQQVPGVNDLALHVGAGVDLTINGNLTVDSFRTGGDGNFGSSVVNHTAGILAVLPTVQDPAGTVNGPNPVSDAGFWIGEFGPNSSTYNLSGGTVTLSENFDAFQVARGGGSVGIFNFTSGTINITAGSDTNIGLDGTATFNQSGGVFSAAQVHVGHFQSPNVLVNLSGNAAWNLGGALLLSDEQTRPDLFADAQDELSQLTITGSAVTINTFGFGARGQSTLSWVADANGVSPIRQVGGGGVALADRFQTTNFPTLSLNLTPYIGAGGTQNPNAVITLIDGTFLPTTGRFDGLAEGAVVANTGGRRITYAGGDGFDVALVPASLYQTPGPAPGLPDGVVARWSMAPNSGPKPFGATGDQPVTLDVRTATGEGVIRPRVDVTASEEHLFFFNAATTNAFRTSTDVPPTNMFINGNTGGAASYDAGASVAPTDAEGALFYPQDVYGNEFSANGSFSVETFVKSGNTGVQQILLQGEGFARWGLTMNEGLDQNQLPVAGGFRFFINNGTAIETIDIGAPVGGENYADNQWHYLLATFEKGAGANGFGQLKLSVTDQDGTTAQVVRDLTGSLFTLPTGNDGNLLVGAEEFLLATDGSPRRFQGLIDEVQLTRGLVPANKRLGVLNLATALTGDYNGDGTVNAADYTIWRDTLNSTTNLAADGNQNNIIDSGDYLVWRSNFGNGVGPGSSAAFGSAVPEPHTALLAVILALVGLTLRPGRRSSPSRG